MLLDQPSWSLFIICLALFIFFNILCLFLNLRPVVEYARSGSSLSTDYGSWQIVSGCGSIHDLPPVPSVSPLPFSLQDEGPSGRMWVSYTLQPELIHCILWDWMSNIIFTCLVMIITIGIGCIHRNRQQLHHCNILLNPKTKRPKMYLFFWHISAMLLFTHVNNFVENCIYSVEENKTFPFN